MGFAPLAVKPGVTAEQTPTLLAAGISESQLIRHRALLPEKYGGWTKFINLVYGSPIRDLHAWQGINNDKHLWVGAEGQEAIITGGVSQDITPRFLQTNPAVNFSVVNGSFECEIVDPGVTPSVYMYVFIEVPVAIDGVVVSGGAQISTVTGAHSYKIIMPFSATSTVPNAGVVPSFTTTNGQPSVTVTLNNHGLFVGELFRVAVSTAVGGVVLLGNYVVQSTPTANTFTINATSVATSNATVSENGGNTRIDYYIATGPVVSGSGYGLGGYGLGGYGIGSGSGSPTAGSPITAIDWTSDNWGEILLACPANGPVYSWSPDSGFATLTVVSGAPIINGGIFIAMPAQILVCWASSTGGVQDPLLVRWSDAGDYTNFVATSQTQGGSYRIPTGSILVAGLNAPLQALLWTDVDLWAMQYIEPPLVFGFNKLGTGCGAISSHGHGILGGTVYWMGLDQFYSYAGSNVVGMGCDVWDKIFQNIDTAHIYKVRCAPSSGFDEIAWYYPSKSGGGEVDSYVKVNLVDGQPPLWDYGTLARSAWTDQNVFGEPIGASPQGYVYQHESGNDADNVAMNAWFKTGYFTLQEGEEFVFIDQLIPDFKYGKDSQPKTAQLQITFYLINWPNQTTPTTVGPYSIAYNQNFISPRLRARQIAMKIESNDFGSWWRLGKLRFRFSSDGRAGGYA